jgi:hypothetical protein
MKTISSNIFSADAHAGGGSFLCADNTQRTRCVPPSRKRAPYAFALLGGGTPGEEAGYI